MASDCTEQSILEFLMKSGGRVEHMELINHFELIWKNDSTQTKDRETLSRLVDAVALVTVENGVKFVCMKMDCLDAVRRTDANVYAVECNGNGVNTHDSSLSRTSAPTVDLNETSDDCFNGNSNDKDQTREKSPISPVLVDNNPKPHVSSSRVAISKEPASSTLGQVANDTTTTFAGTEVKMRERRRRESAPAIGSELDHPAHPVGHHCQVRGGRRISKGSQRAMLTSGLSEDSPWEGLDTLGDSSTPKGSRRNFIELMMSSSPQVRRSMIHRSSCLRDSVKGDGDTASLLSSSATDEDCCASVTLDPLEHEWMLCASDGQWDSLQPLLAVEPSLLSKRDFVTGFTCLHWAAKQGKVELLGQLLSFARDSAVPVDVNGRSGSGYTPMHLAAMHCHTQVVRTLVSDWEADTEVRDYSGKQAIQYLPPPLAADLHHQGVVAATSPTGAPPGTDAESTDRGGGTGRGWRLARALQSGNLNPLRLLNPSAEATEPDAGASCKPKAGALQRKSSLGRLNARLHRGRRRAQIIHSPSFRESGEVRGDEPLCSPVRTRPMSSLFG
ncbi:ankyrin repeat domain-containing protein SOWAHC [Gadus morhua]|uniref:ankyrin repeat domain-containing protein SOWAHC n=1 Tax=Gadus morhua TaxID=8049 RepID=UPI0011B428DC|nr:ankyrin repeat domain-containing protein SOWAHC [Gadus morhua]